MNLKNANFAEIMTENTYPVLLNISEYHSEDQRDERGRSYFGSDAGLIDFIIINENFDFTQ